MPTVPHLRALSATALVGALLAIAPCSCTAITGSKNSRRPADAETARTHEAVASVALPTGERATSVLLLQKTTPQEVCAGEPFEYRITVRNITDQPLEEVVVYERARGPVRLRGADSERRADESRVSRSTMAASHRKRLGDDGDDQRTAASGERSWRVGHLAAGESKSITVRGVAGETGELSWCTSASYVPTLCHQTRVTDPQVVVERIVSERADGCEPIPIRYRVRNVGTGTARQITIREDLPDGMRTAEGARTIELELPTLAEGGTEELVAKVRADRAGEFRGHAVGTFNGSRSIESDETAMTIRRPELHLSVSAPDQAFTDNPIDFRVRVVNRGNLEARNLVVEQRLADGVELVEASHGGTLEDGVLTWKLDPLGTDGATRLHARVKTANKGAITSRISAKAYCAAAVEDTARVEVSGIAAMLLEVVDNNDPVPVDGKESYDITVTNQGSKTARDVRIVAELPAHFEYVSASGPARSRVNDDMVTFLVDRIPAGGKVQLSLIAKALQPGDIRFRVAMTSAELTAPVIETEATRIY